MCNLKENILIVWFHEDGHYFNFNRYFKTLKRHMLYIIVTKNIHILD